MIIVHGAMLDGRFMLWGETPQAELAKRRKPRYHLPGEIIPTYPYAVARALLLDALANAFPNHGKDVAAQRAHAWLPTADGAPLPSLEGATVVAADVQVRPWVVHAQPATPRLLLELLACRGPAISVDLILGPELQAWQGALRFAQELVARRRVAPGIRQTPKHFHAEWEPIINGRDGARLAELADALPGACRTLTPPYGHPPQLAAYDALTDFIAIAVDALMRAAGPMPVDPPGEDKRYAQFYWPIQYRNSYDRWLLALGAPDSRIGGYQADLGALAQQIAAWQTRRVIEQAPQFRLCLRLEEPDDDGTMEADEGVRQMPPAAQDPWHLRFLLQARDDPSLLLDANIIWSAEEPDELPRGITKAGLRMALLAGLGRVAPHYAPIAQTMHAPNPTGIDLETPEAFAFLTEFAAKLEGAGCVVQLPSWWARAKMQRRVKLRASVQNQDMGSGLGSHNLITFDWKVALGDVEISHAELQALARLKTPLVQVRGRWVQVGADQIGAALDFWQKQANRRPTLGDVARLALDDHARLDGMEVERVDLHGWLAESFDKLRRGNATVEDLPPPEGLHATLRPYQQRGFAWLRFLSRYGLGACLADDMGLGKSVMSLALIQHDWEADGHQPVLIVCPTSVVGNWLREAARFTPNLPVLAHHGLGRRKDDAFAAEVARHAVVITSYPLLHRDAALLRSVNWRGVIMDEAQNIKNAETKAAKAAAALPGNYRIALTGTPVENSVADLWALMDFLNPNLLGSAKEFKQQFFVPIQTRRDPEATVRLKRLTGPFILRRLKTDPAVISDLPEKNEMTVFCTLTKEQASLYQAVLREMETRIESLEGMARRGLIFATLTRLKQICNHPAHFLGDGSALANRSGKLERLDAMTEEALAEGDQMLIFTQFAEMGLLLQRYLTERFGYEIPFLHGQTPPTERDRMVERFQAEHGPPIFLLSLKAGGTGLNLTRANRVFHYDRWWNPAVENQATDRAFRIGQTRAVQVHKFTCAGTLEERIAHLIEGKSEIAANVVGTGEGWLTELSTEQLRDLFALRPDAVEV